MTASAQLLPPPAGLRACVYAAVVRDTRPLGPADAPAQRLNRFPALPFFGITWILHGSARLVAPAGHPDLGPLPPTFVSGPQSAPFASVNDGPLHSFCLVLHAHAIRPLTGLPASQLRDRHRPLAEALDADWATLDALVRAAPDDAARLAAAAAWLRPRWQAVRGRLDQRLADLPAALQSMSVAALAAARGWTARQLERRSHDALGLSPREARAIERVHAAVLAESEGRPLAETADAQGFADQPHMTREWQRLAGVSPARLRREMAGDDESWWLFRLHRQGRP